MFNYHICRLMNLTPFKAPKSFRSKVLYSFLSFILILFVWIAFYFFISGKQKQLQQFSNNLTQVQNQFLESNRHLQYFILSGFHEPVFYTTEKQKDIDTFLGSQQKSIDVLAQINTEAQANHINLDKELNSLSALHRMLVDSTIILKSLYLGKGFKDFGAEGRMRSFAHQLEKDNLVPGLELLMLRRHEKDYLIRGDANYSAQYNILIDKLLAGYAAGSPAAVALLGYKTNFNSLANYNSRLGVINNQGVYKNVQTIINNIGNTYGLAEAQAAQEIEVMHNAFKTILIVVSLLLIAVVIGLSVFLSKSLTADIKELNRRLFAFVDNNFKTTEEEDSKAGEFVPSTTETNELYTHFLLLKKNLKHTFDDLEKTNLDLKIHAENQQILYDEMHEQSEKLQAKSNELYLKTDNLRLMNMQLEDERKKAEIANREKSVFLATMSREIHIPMKSIVSSASMLDGTALDAEQTKYLKTIKNNSDKLVMVINDMLTLQQQGQGMHN